jgi:ketosteroid isomerase-like protein
MSQENVEIVRDYFETVNGGDFARAMRYYVDDVELVVPGGTGGFLEAGRFTGKDAVGLWFGNWFRAFQRGYRFDLDEIRAVGEAVFVLARHEGRGKASGAEVCMSTAYLFRVAGGQIGKIELFVDRRSALEAVGLSEQDAQADA